MFKIQTDAFKTAMAKAAKGASCNKILPLTSLLALEVKDGSLMLATTDSENNLEVYVDGVKGKDMSAVVSVELMSKLIAKQTCPSISVSLKDEYLEVKGNGVYKVPLITDEEGLVEFPFLDFDAEELEPEEVLLSSIRHAVEVGKSSLCTDAALSYLRVYHSYVPEEEGTLPACVITTTGECITINRFKLMEKTISLTPSMMELLLLNTEEKIICYRTDDEILFDGGSVLVHGPVCEHTEEFPIEDIEENEEVSFPSSCELVKDALSAVIDRLCLFVEPFDKNAATLNFTKTGLQVSSLSSSSVEELKYTKSEKFKPVRIMVDVQLLKSQLDSIPGQTVGLQYGNDQAIKFTSGNITKMLALFDEEVQVEIPQEEEVEE